MALSVIRDSVELVRQGRAYHMAPLYGQLRALLTDRASGNDPLIPAIAKETGFDLNLFAMPGVDSSGWPAEVPEPEIHIDVGAPSLFRVAPGQVEMTLADYLARKLALFSGHTYSAKKIIEDLANTSGGAHYSKDLKQQVAWFLQIGFGQQPAVVNGLLQVAEFTQALGTEMIRRLSGATLALDVVLLDKPDGSEAVIFDSVYPDSEMRLTVRLRRDNRIQTDLLGIDGTRMLGLSDHSLPCPSRGVVVIRFEVEEDLSTRLETLLNGHLESVSKSRAPIFLVANRDADWYFNRSAEDENAGMHLGLVELALFGPEADALGHAQMAVYMMSSERMAKDSCVEYPIGTWGLSSTGNGDQELTGHGRFRKVSELLPQ